MMKKYEVSQPQKNKFYFHRSTSEKAQEAAIYITYSPDVYPGKLIANVKTDEFVLEIDVMGKRPYFYVEAEHESYLTAERTLPVEGMNNFRDMGGYETKNGHTLKWGKLYRSDHIYNATDKGVEYLNRLGIHTIIDYRSDVEISKYPNKILNPQANTVHLDPAAHAAELAAQFQSSKDEEDLNLINKIIEQQKSGTLVDQADVVLKQYQTFANKPESKHAFAEMLRVIARPESPAIVQHCRGGKDRTGFGAMLVLGILGVNKEDILADYLLTAKNREKRNRIKMERYRKLTSDQSVLDHLYSFIDTKSEFLETSIDTIVDNYGSIKNYVLSDLKITQEEIQSIEELYLE